MSPWVWIAAISTFVVLVFILAVLAYGTACFLILRRLPMATGLLVLAAAVAAVA
jgi:hypothetical protein